MKKKLNATFNQIIDKNQYKNLGKLISNEISETKIQKNKELPIESIPDSKIILFNIELISNIDFDDKLFIVRSNKLEDLLENKEIDSLMMSIYNVGLINPIYLQIKENKKYRIVSGYRRAVAIKKGISTYGNEYVIDGTVIIIPSYYTFEELDILQLNENTHRENLNILDLAQSFYNKSNNLKISLEEIGDEYNLSTRQVSRIKNIFRYPKPLQEALNKINLSKAEEINKIIKFFKYNENNHLLEIQKLVNQYLDFTRTELRDELKFLKQNQKKSKIDIKYTKNSATFKIMANLSENEIVEIKQYINVLLKKSNY